MTVDLRQKILDRLAELGKSANWLAEQQTIAHPQTIRRYLYGQGDTSSAVVGELFRILGLELKGEDDE